MAVQTEKFIDGRWQVVPPVDRLKVTQLDGQVWLALVNLLVEPACRAKYDPDDYRWAGPWLQGLLLTHTRDRTMPRDLSVFAAVVAAGLPTPPCILELQWRSR